MKKFNTIFLHFGLDKTGSTAIQNFLDKNREKLLNLENIAYAPGLSHGALGSAFCDSPEQYIFNTISNNFSQTKLQEDAKEYLKKITEWIIKIKPCQSLIFSYEGFPFLDNSALQRLKNFCEEWTDNLKIIIYIRPPLSYAVSAMSQRSKQGLQAWLEDDPPLQSHNIYIKKIKSIFGKNNLIIEKFQNNIIENFSYLVNINCKYDFIYEKLNKSLSRDGIYLAEKFRSLLLENNIQYSQSDFYKKFGQYLSAITGESTRLSIQNIEIIHSHTKIHSEYIEKEFNISLEENLNHYTEKKLISAQEKSMIDSFAQCIFNITHPDIAAKSDYFSPELTLLSATCASDRNVLRGQNLVFSLEFSLSISVSELEIGIHILDDNRQWAFGTNTTLLDKKIFFIQPGTHCLKYQLVIDLPEGAYTAGFAFRSLDPQMERELAWSNALFNLNVSIPRLQACIGYASMPVMVTCTKISDIVVCLVDEAFGKIRVDNALGSVVQGELFCLSVVLENLSSQTWGNTHTNSLALSYHWQDMEGINVLFDGLRSLLPVNSIQPSTNLPIIMRVKAPTFPGEYRLVILPLQEGHGWFDDFGFTPAVLNVTVLPNGSTRFYFGNDCRLSSECGIHNETTLAANGQEGFLLNGPYVPLTVGNYVARLNMTGSATCSGAWMDVSSAGGTQVYARVDIAPLPMQSTELTVAFELLENCTDLEIRIWVPAGTDLALHSLRIEPAVVSMPIAEPAVTVNPTNPQYSLSELERTEMTVSCNDCANLPKVPNSGQVTDENGLRVQQMHDGTRVVAGGYYGEWMQTVIQRLSGHHEPQEELLFHTLLKHARPASLMVEFGCYWAYYSNWYLGAVPQSKVICIEPDENRMQIGIQNMQLNHREAVFHVAAAGGLYQAEQAFVRESDGTSVMIPVWDFATLLEKISTDCIELLHMDTQGAELPFLQSIARTQYTSRLRFVVISTHHACISGSATTHRDCLIELIDMGAFILCEHSVDESFSGDGLIVASFRAEDAHIPIPHMSLNQPENSLFGPDPKRVVKQSTGWAGHSQPSELSQTMADRVEVVQTVDGPMHIYKDDAVIGASLKANGAFQTEKIDEVLSFLKQRFAFTPDFFVDIGANIGTHLVHALKSGEFSRGLAFEPDPLNYALLTQNIAIAGLSDKVQAHKLALSSRNGSTTFELCGSNFGDHRVRTMCSTPGITFGEDKRRIISVLTDTGDDFFEEHGLDLSAKTLIWTDTQGHEGHVFNGLKKHFSQFQKPFIVCEFWPYGLERAGGKELFFDFLKNCSVIYDINRQNWQNNSEYSIHRLEKLYQIMINDTRENYYPHTDILCIL